MRPLCNHTPIKTALLIKKWAWERRKEQILPFSLQDIIVKLWQSICLIEQA
jgi:hypothetical protein